MLLLVPVNVTPVEQRKERPPRSDNKTRNVLTSLVCYIWCVTSGVLHLVCYIWCVTSGVLHLVCYIWCVTSGVLHLVCYIWCVTSGVLHLVCYIWCVTSGVLHLVCYIWCVASGGGCLGPSVLDVWVPLCRMLGVPCVGCLGSPV